jgi:hypothetical protein
MNPFGFVFEVEAYALWIGSFVGLMTGILVPFLAEANVRNYAKKWARPDGILPKVVLRKRARAAIVQHKVRMAWPYLLPLIPLNPFILAGMGGAEGLALAIIYLSVYSLSSVGFYFVHGRKLMRRFREILAVEVAQQLAFRVEPDQSSEILMAAAQQKDSCHRFAAVLGLRELGTMEALHVLDALRDDNNPQVAALATEAWHALHQDLDPTSRPCPELPAYVLRKVLPDSDAKEDRVRERNRIKAMELHDDKELRRLLNAQLPLRRGHPHLFCMECYARTVYLRSGEWDWVECRLCGKSGSLETDVKAVIGQVGGDYEWLLEEGILRINLWDQDNKKARAADIDVLEIVDGGEIDYDWALTAVLEVLERRGNAPEKQWHIRAGELPLLQKNTLKLLQRADPRFPPAI